MNDRIPPERADELFFYARRVTHDRRRGRWTITVDPDSCITGYADDVEVPVALEELTATAPEQTTSDGTTTYSGRIPFSAGVILLVDDAFVLLRRDAAAPVDPLMWTSPAGRCDADPTTTALRELYEELLVQADGRAAVVKPPENGVHGDGDPNSGDVIEAYRKTLQRNGVYSPRNRWVEVNTTVPPEYTDELERVETRYGDESFVDDFWAYWDEQSSTLELRKVYRLDRPADVDAVTFADAEYERKTSVVPRERLFSFDDADLVPTNRAFRTAVPQP